MVILKGFCLFYEALFFGVGSLPGTKGTEKGGRCPVERLVIFKEVAEKFERILRGEIAGNRISPGAFYG